MKTRSAKQKGRRLQQNVRDLLLEALSEYLEEDDIRSTSMGAPGEDLFCLLYTSPSPRDRTRSRMPSSA